MRIVPLIPPLAMAACLLGCSDRSGSARAHTVDVAAAAARAQSDIANYAAAAGSQTPDADGRPVRAPAPLATATEAAVPAEAQQPGAVVRRYVEAIGGRRYAEAWRLWDGGGAASGMTEAAFAASFARYASFVATVGKPGDEDAGAGQRYVTVPVTVVGTLRSGGPFRLEGPIVLHRVADGIESDDPDAHRWRVRSSEMKPRPLLAEPPPR